MQKGTEDESSRRDRPITTTLRQNESLSHLSSSRTCQVVRLPLDVGHSIVCVPKQFYREESADLIGYLVLVSVKTVLRGYEQQSEYIVVDVPYDSTLGIISPPEDYEY